MGKKDKRHPLYVLFLLLMWLLLACGVALLISGSIHNGVVSPRLPGMKPIADALAMLHG